jgi:formylglycine-generating enzyme
MALRRLLMSCVAFAAMSSMFGTFALAQKHAASGESGSCSAYSGLPSEDNDTAGMVFIRGGTFLMGS